MRTTVSMAVQRVARSVHPRSAIRYPLLAACAALASGCVTQTPAPDFSAAWPEVVEPSDTTSGAIYQVGRDVALFENAIARRVGDTVTIRLMEATNASKSSSTATKKSTEVDIAAPTGIGGRVTVNGTGVGVGIDNAANFAGSGNSAQSNKLEGQITVTVAKRLSNGNLLVRGQKWLTLNQGSEFVRVQGIVRPADIDPDNSIPSFKVADASISYGGKGALAEASAPGLLSRFFNLPWLPF